MGFQINPGGSPFLLEWIWGPWNVGTKDARPSPGEEEEKN